MALVSSPSFSLSNWASVSQIQAGQPVAEPAAPKPLPEVQAILDEAHQFEEAKKFEELLKAADRALGVAREKHDAVGEALAQEARAKALQNLKRSDDAVTAWKEAARAWELAGDGPGQIETLAQQGLIVFSSGQQAEAVQLFAQALTLGKNESRRPLAASEAMVQAAKILYGARAGVPSHVNRAKEFLLAALAIQEKLAPRSPGTVEILSRLGLVATKMFDYHSAQEFLHRAMVLGEQVAPNTLTVARILDRLGELESYRENLAESRSYYERAITLKEKLDPESLELAFTLDRAGITIDQQGDLSAARQVFQRSLAIREKLDPESASVTDSLNDLAIVERQWGNLAAARAYLVRVLLMQDRRLGPGSVDSASTQINLGNIASDEGEYAKARHHFETALAIYAKSNPEAFGVPVALDSLRSVAYLEGDLPSALEYGQQALVRYEKVAPDQLYVAEELSGLGDIFRAQGVFQRAEEHYRRALAIREKRVPDSLDVAKSYHTLGELARVRGDLSTAIGFNRKALAIGLKVAPASLDVAAMFHSSGELAYLQGDFAAALREHQSALEIRQRATGPDHPDVAKSLLSIAEIQLQTGDTSAALKNASRAESIGREHLRVSARTLSERQALAYTSVRASGLDVALTLAVDGRRESAVIGEVFDSVIRSRALVFDEMAARHRAVHGTEDPDVTGVAKQLFSARTRLAMLVVRGPGDNAPEVYRKLLDEARKEKEEAERAMAEKSNAFRQEQEKSQVGLQGVVAALPAGAGLVAFVRFNRHQMKSRAANERPPEPVPSYLAFVLRPDASEPAIVPLGTAKEIEALIADWQKQMAQEAMLAGPSSKRSEAAYRKTALVLRKKIWDPVAAQLGSTRRIFVVPDGALHLVNLASLPIGDFGYLIERGPLIHYLSTERDLVPFGTREEGKGLLALGAPAFDETKLFASLAPKQLASELPAEMPAVSHAFRGTRSTCGTFQSMRFEPLPASAREVREVAALWPARGGPQSDKEFRGQQYRDSVVELRGAAASEAALKQQVQGKRVLHLATHGFFLGGRCTSGLDAKATEFGDSTPAIGDSPLLLSGLALAGANHRSAAGPDEEDGILTAEEIASLDLNGVDWAVLSACDTGVREIKAGEGVFGLRRAFQVAGARTVIMSLWQVEDQGTRQWMTALYKNRFRRGLGTAESVRAASLQLLSQRRAANQSTHPFYWAGFIATGDWR